MFFRTLIGISLALNFVISYIASFFFYIASCIVLCIKKSTVSGYRIKERRNEGRKELNIP